MRQNLANTNATHIYNNTVTSGGATQIGNQNTAIQALSAGGSAMTWSEGLALGCKNLTDEWKANSTFSATTSAAGTTTSSRAALNGTVSGAITETAFFFSAYSIDATDLVRFILTNDGAGNGLYAAVVDAAYTTMGASYSGTNGCTMNANEGGSPTACDMIFTITVAHGYTNSGAVAACQPTVTYGGGICDPTAYTASVFEELNNMRTNAASTYAPLLQAVYDATWSTTGAPGTVSTVNWDGTGNSNRTFLLGKAGVLAAKNAVNTAGNNLTQFTWSPGLFLAAKDHAAYLSTLAGVSSTGTGGSTAATRVGLYGTKGNSFEEVLYMNDDTVANTIVMMLIDDTNASDRAALINSAYTQGGMSILDNTSDSTKKTGVLYIANTFTTNEPYASCTLPSISAQVITANAIALAAAAGSLTLAALF